VNLKKLHQNLAPVQDSDHWILKQDCAFAFQALAIMELDQTTAHIDFAQVTAATLDMLPTATMEHAILKLKMEEVAHANQVLMELTAATLSRIAMHKISAVETVNATQLQELANVLQDS